MSVPNRYLIRSVMPSGVRLPKKPTLPKFVAPASRTVGEIWANNRKGIVTVAKGAFDHLFKVEDKRRVSDFNNDEFRFWVGAEPGSGNMALCRQCRTACYSRQERREHLKLRGCATKLIAAYKILLAEKPMRCTVCSSLTTAHVWGVPLCANGPCMNRWMYSFNQWGELVNAMVSVRQQEFAATKTWEQQQREYGVLRAEDFQ